MNNSNSVLCLFIAIALVTQLIKTTQIYEKNAKKNKRVQAEGNFV